MGGQSTAVEGGRRWGDGGDGERGDGGEVGARDRGTGDSDGETRDRSTVDSDEGMRDRGAGDSIRGRGNGDRKMGKGVTGKRRRTRAGACSI